MIATERRARDVRHELACARRAVASDISRLAYAGRTMDISSSRVLHELADPGSRQLTLTDVSRFYGVPVMRLTATQKALAAESCGGPAAWCAGCEAAA
jgi:hypothetical protein